MAKHAIIVEQCVEVDLVESAFTEDFMNEFSDSFYPFSTVSEHAGHIAQLAARGLLEPLSIYQPGCVFVEGYGDAADFIRSINIMDQETHLVQEGPDNG